MQVRDLTEAECLQVLQRLSLGRIACAKDNQPYVVPAYLYLDGRYLYSFATVGQKIEWMRANPQVCVEVDETTDASHWTTVLAYGYYEELPDTPEHRDARQRALSLFQTRRAWWGPAAAKRGTREHHVAIVYRISITRLTGRRTSSVETGS
jgi:nitroimidazol reductase NimA-like FMN-containing flavoprotein (pyridoxamine 5'-phosphate oxidase superfamily)